ncbi:spore gernimation protein [Brevibacillus fluminis]|uniref:Spore gernimation protein n=1 Tax=Brevibacillus fluminis TaxID=511487 RepID=A0A3M8DUY7_9BACL|nr:GerAB/ArcD/ProY family transporter [Brevibacillus fluminis]RNB91980.1 spore gernimation protein [Brevibacillus fluminis]
MDKGNFPKLQSYHVIFLVQNVITGEGLLRLPHTLSPTGYNEWWVLFILGILAQITLFPMYWLGLQYPRHNLFQINEILLGRWLGKFVTIIFILYGILTVSATSQSYLRLVGAITLPDIAPFFPLFCLYGVMLYIAGGGIKLIARFCILAFFFTFWMLYFLLWPMSAGGASHMFPLFTAKPAEIQKAVNDSYFSMFGYELLLIYFPYIVNQKKALKHASIGIWMVILSYEIVTFVSIMYFSEWQLANVIYPVLSLFKSVKLSFIERVENLGVALWVFLILSTTAGYLWMSKLGVDFVFSKKRGAHLYICAVVSFSIILVLPLGKMETTIYRDWTQYGGYFMILFPLILLAVHAIRKRGIKKIDMSE